MEDLHRALLPDSIQTNETISFFHWRSMVHSRDSFITTSQRSKIEKIAQDLFREQKRSPLVVVLSNKYLTSSFIRVRESARHPF